MQPCTIWGIVFVICALIIFVPYFNTSSRRVSGMFLGVMIAGLFGMQSQQTMAEIIAAFRLIFGLIIYTKWVQT